MLTAIQDFFGSLCCSGCCRKPEALLPRMKRESSYDSLERRKTVDSSKVKQVAAQFSYEPPVPSHPDPLTKTHHIDTDIATISRTSEISSIAGLHIIPEESGKISPKGLPSQISIQGGQVFASSSQGRIIKQEPLEKMEKSKDLSSLSVENSTEDLGLSPPPLVRQETLGSSLLTTTSGMIAAQTKIESMKNVNSELISLQGASSRPSIFFADGLKMTKLDRTHRSISSPGGNKRFQNFKVASPPELGRESSFNYLNYRRIKQSNENFKILYRQAQEGLSKLEEELRKEHEEHQKDLVVLKEQLQKLTEHDSLLEKNNRSLKTELTMSRSRRNSTEENLPDSNELQIKIQEKEEQISRLQIRIDELMRKRQADSEEEPARGPKSKQSELLDKDQIIESLNERILALEEANARTKHKLDQKERQLGKFKTTQNELQMVEEVLEKREKRVVKKEDEVTDQVATLETGWGESILKLREEVAGLRKSKEEQEKTIKEEHDTIEDLQDTIDKLKSELFVSAQLGLKLLEQQGVISETELIGYQAEELEGEEPESL